MDTLYCPWYVFTIHEKTKRWNQKELGVISADDNLRRRKLG